MLQARICNRGSWVRSYKKAADVEQPWRRPYKAVLLLRKLGWQSYVTAVTHSGLTQSNSRAFSVMFFCLLAVTVVAGAPL